MEPRSIEVLIFLGIATAIECWPEANTNIGKFVGTTKQVNVEDITYGVKLFLGIPYAQPPVGKLRFMKPKPADALIAVYNATSDMGLCLQTVQGNEEDKRYSENCLYLNMYVPDRQPDSENGMAVMVSLHEDLYMSNPNKTYDPSVLSAFGNIVIVTISYRTGFFGYVDLETKSGKGNLGFWDQHLALKWINKHITAFGGDRSRVTLLGQSAGATAVLQHGLFPKNRNLIHRIIPQSLRLASLNPDLTKDKTAPFQLIATALGCESNNSVETAECLQSADTDFIIQTLKPLSLHHKYKKLVHFLSHTDNTLISEFSGNRTELNENQRVELEFYRTLDLLIGYNSNDGLEYSGLLSSDIDNFRPSMKDFQAVCLETALQTASLETEPLVSEIITAEYTGGGNFSDPDFIRQKCIDLLTDVAFSVESVKAAILHADGLSPSSRTFLYQFSASPTAHEQDTPTWIQGPALRDEVRFLFGVDELGNKDNLRHEGWKYNLSHDMMTYWTNFVKSGNPNHPTPVNSTWPRFDSDLQKYLNISNQLPVRSEASFLFGSKVTFWRNIYHFVLNTSRHKSAISCLSSYVPDDGLDETCALD